MLILGCFIFHSHNEIIGEVILFLMITILYVYSDLSRQNLSTNTNFTDYLYYITIVQQFLFVLNFMRLSSILLNFRRTMYAGTCDRLAKKYNINYRS